MRVLFVLAALLWSSLSSAEQGGPEGLLKDLERIVYSEEYAGWIIDAYAFQNVEEALLP